MRVAAGLLGALAAIAGVVAILVTTGVAHIAARYVVLAAVSCLTGLIGAGLALSGRARPGGLLMLEAPIGIFLSLGEYGQIPAIFFLIAALPGLLGG